jgi:hypothetical protein
MSRSNPPLPALDEIRQLNRLFLGYLRSVPQVATDQFGLSRHATDLLCRVSPGAVDRAADFPRALFRLCLPPRASGTVMDPLGLAQASGRRILHLTLLYNAWHMSRASAYSARLLLRLGDGEIRRLREAEMEDILLMSLSDELVHAEFDDLDWIWQQLLTESRPEQRRWLRLIGLQPDLSLQAAGSRI